MQNSETWISWDIIWAIFYEKFRMILPKICHCVLGSRFAPWKKNKAWHWTPPPPFSTVPSVLAYLLPQPEVANACSIWCVPFTVITASYHSYYTNILLLTNITTWKVSLLICTTTPLLLDSDNNINPPACHTTMPTYFFYPQC